MRKQVTAILMIVGAVLMVASILLVTVSYVNQVQSAKALTELVDDLYTLMPEIQDDIPDGRGDVTMPSVQVDGLDFAGLIEAPGYDRVLPVYAAWESGQVVNYPCRFSGSMYNGSLIIGGSDRQGQLDFIGSMNRGDLVYITDTAGTRYTYVVALTENTKDVSAEHLTSYDGDLVLFARNRYGLDYTVVQCEYNR